MSFALKPLRNDAKYLSCLCFQYVIYSISITIKFYNYFDKSVLTLCIVALTMTVVGLVLFKARSYSKKFSVTYISEKLTRVVVKDGYLIGLAELGFLSFSAVQCEGGIENDNGNLAPWKECYRILSAQVGLGIMVVVYISLKILFGVVILGLVPPRIRKKHEISLKKIVKLNLKADEMVQYSALFLAFCCAMFLLGMYGSQGNFHNDRERYIILSIPIFGTISLLLPAIWKSITIYREMMQETTEENPKNDEEGASPDPEEKRGEEVEEVEEGKEVEEVEEVEEASSFWFGTAVFATTFHSTCNVAASITLDERFLTITWSSFPFIMVAYIFSVLCQPKRNHPRDIWKLRIHFASWAYVSEFSCVVWSYRREENSAVILHLLRAVGQTLLFHYGALKLRARIGKLPVEDLAKFLTNTLFTGALKALFSILFLTFKVVKCIFSNNININQSRLIMCNDVSTCSSFICVYLIIWWMTKLLQGSFRSEGRNELYMSIEKIARLKNISLRRGAEGFFSLTTVVCAIFLFSMMSAERLDDTTVWAVGYTGLCAGMGVLCSELYTGLKEQRRRRIRRLSAELSESGTTTNKKEEDPVDEVSWFYTCISFILTSGYATLTAFYGITLKDRYWFMATIILSIVGISFVMALLSKPKRKDMLYKSFLIFHFFKFAIFSEGMTVVGDCRTGNTINLVFTLFRIPVWCTAFFIALKLRESASKHDPKHLSDFLCETILVRGTGAIGTMAFFAFETVSCYISQNSLNENGQCTDTSTVTLYLSSYVVILTTCSFATRTVPESLQKELIWEETSIATLNFIPWQKAMVGLISITMIATLYLLSSLGVEGDKNKLMLAITGGVGLGTLLVAWVIYLRTVLTLREIHVSKGNLVGEGENPDRRISMGNMQDGMKIAAFV